MNLKRAATIVTTGGGLAAWLVGSTTSGPRTVAPPPAIDRAPIERRGAALATEMARFHDHMQPSTPPRQPGRNLFKFREPPPHATPSNVAPAPPPPENIAVPPPVPPMRLVGVSEDPGPAGPVRKAFVNADGQLFIVKEGDVVLMRYKVTKISGEVIELTDTEDGTVRRLALR
jgi:hypothetical protein